MTSNNRTKRYIDFLRANFVLVFALALLTACGGGGPAPTLVPTLAPPASPVSTATSHPFEPAGGLPTVTSHVGPATRTPLRQAQDQAWPSDTPTGQPEPIKEHPACDADTLAAYEDFVARLQSVYTALAGQGYTQDALLAAIPQMERLLAQTDDLPTPCDRAYWLRLTLSERINAEIPDLQKFADNPNQGDPAAAIAFSPLIADALAALRAEVDAALTPAAPTETPTPAPFLCDCSGDLYDCNYFRSQAEAQSCYDYCLPRAGDVHDLDPDGDGVACPDLP